MTHASIWRRRNLPLCLSRGWPEGAQLVGGLHHLHAPPMDIRRWERGHSTESIRPSERTTRVDDWLSSALVLVWAGSGQRTCLS